MTANAGDQVRLVLVVVTVVAVLMEACGDAGSDAGDALDDLELIGVDFELGSFVLTNNGSEPVRTEGLWLYQEGQASEFNIFTIEPRASILFSARDVGGIETAGGELALYSAELFDDPDAMVDYVAWGGSGHTVSAVAVDATVWSVDDTVETEAGTVLLTKVVGSATGSIAWEASEET